MGKITVIGHAEREVSYDQVTVTISFKANEKNSTRASETVIKQCEDFLSALKKKGIAVNQIHLDEDSIEGTIVATRSIKMDIPYNMDFMNYLLKLIQERGSDIVYRTSYRLSDEKKIHDELMQEAMRDSKARAESLAEALGQRVIGLKSATNNMDKVLDKFLNCMKLCDEGGSGYCEDELLSSELSAPTTIESEDLEAVWLISGSDNE